MNQPERTPEESALAYRASALGETEVREIMVPRVDMIAIESGVPWSEVLDRVRSSERARLPVYRQTLDDITGILYAKDLLRPAIEEREPPGGWETLARPATFIPPSKSIARQLTEFQRTRTHIAIVSDEYGGTAGMVTIEDVLEEIVGEIRDERDLDEPDITRQGADRYWVAGKVSLAELSEAIGVHFERDDVTTVGGLVYAAFGRVPRAGDATTIHGFRLVVERLRRRRVDRVYFERVEPVPAPIARPRSLFAVAMARLGRLVTRLLDGRRAAPPDSGPGGDTSRRDGAAREAELASATERERGAMMSGVLGFRDKRVRDVLTAREHIVAVAEGASPRAMAEVVAGSGYSRVPVFRGTLDHIVGIVYAFDLLGLRDDTRLTMRPVARAAGETRCTELLVAMLRDHHHLAVAHDAAGRTLGIVTLEDLLEELVGDIRDEHDDPSVSA